MKAIRVVATVCGCVLSVLSGAAPPQQTDQFESLLVSAQQAQARGEFESAAEFYRKAVGIHPENPELTTNLGLMYYQTGQDQQAIDAFKQAIRLKPGLFVPNLFLGLDYVKSKQFKEAIPYLKRAAISKPTDIQVRLALGQAYRGRGRTRLAIASYLRAVQLEPENANGWFQLGVSYLEQVEADARLLLARHQDSAYLQALVAESFAEQRKFIQAADAYRKLLTLPAFPPGVHASYGFVLINRHDLQGAERELSAELASNPGCLMAKLGLARLHVEQGAAAEGADEIGEISRIDSSFLRVNASLFDVRLPKQEYSELLRVLEERQAGGDISPGIVDLFRSLATNKRVADMSQHSGIEDNPAPRSKAADSSAAELYASGRYGDCSDLLASRLPLLQSKDLQLLASCAYSNGNFRNAFDAGAQLAVNAATEAEGLYWETRSSQKLATQVLAHASQIDSTSPKLHVLLGDIYRQRKYFPDAEQEYRKGLALQPEDTGALFGLSLALLADDEIDEAFCLAQTALQRSPGDPELNAVMGEILCARGDFSGAEPYLEKGLHTKPELIPRVHALLAKVYAQTNRTQQAISELKRALPDDKDGHLHYQIARLYLKVGDRNSAKQAFEASDRMRRQGLTRAAVALEQGGDDGEPQ